MIYAFVAILVSDEMPFLGRFITFWDPYSETSLKIPFDHYHFDHGQCPFWLNKSTLHGQDQPSLWMDTFQAY